MLAGAAGRPRVTLLTALPLSWGEGDADDIVAGRSTRSATLAALERRFEIRAIDTVDVAAMGKSVLVLAQPRRLAPAELVALDSWVRAGGRALIFADPELLWPSRLPLGHPRRPPPVTLLDPLFAHWGIALGDSDHGERVAMAQGVRIATASAGRWHATRSCASPDPLVIDCRIGRGRAILVGDADVFDERLWQTAKADNPAWIAALITRLIDSQPIVR